MSGRRVLATAWSGMGVWRWAGVLLVAIALALTPLGGPSRLGWLAVAPLAGSEGLPVTLESMCRAATGRCRWRLRIEGEGDYRWRASDAESWKTVASGSGSGARTVALVAERRTGRIEACTATPPERCVRWDLTP